MVYIYGLFLFHETGVGSDVAGVQTTVREDGDYWIINGEKGWVMSALESQAMVVFATFDKELRQKGIACMW